MMRDIAELFPTDDPVPANMMIGRGRDVEEIAAALVAGTNVVLAGPRRTGKTSVAEAALARARCAGLYTATVDLFRRRDASDLAEGLAEAVLANRAALRRLMVRAREAAGTVLDAASLSASAHAQAELGEGVELARRPGRAAREPTRALAAALELPERIASADGRRIAVFLDEFQDIASPGRPFGDPDRVTKQMRAIFQRSPHVSFLFAGSIERLMRDLFGPSDRALSQFGTFRPLSPITEREWRTGLSARFEAATTAIEDGALALLVELGAGHPRSTMLIAREALTAALTADHDRIREHEVRAGFELAVAADRLRHEQALERIKLTKHAQAVAMRIAREQRPYPGLAPSAAQRALRALELAGLIDSPARGQWRVTDPLLRNYLAGLPGR
jgi:hypothetical protein